jgi:hypothetical protein
MLAVSRAFRRQGLPAAGERLSACGPRNPGAELAQEDLEHLAWNLRVMSRFLTGQQRCLPEALCIAAGLRAVGYPADVVVGHESTAMSIGDRLHAWVEVSGVVVNAEVLPGFYEVLQRLPDPSA